MPRNRSLPDVPRMDDPGVYELLRAMRMMVIDLSDMMQQLIDKGTVTPHLSVNSDLAIRPQDLTPYLRGRIAFGRDSGEFAAYNETTEKFEFYKGGVLVYSLPP